MPRSNVYYSKKDVPFMAQVKELARVQTGARMESVTFSSMVMELLKEGFKKVVGK